MCVIDNMFNVIQYVIHITKVLQYKVSDNEHFLWLHDIMWPIHIKNVSNVVYHFVYNGNFYSTRVTSKQHSSNYFNINFTSLFIYTYYTIVTMIQQWLTGILTLMIIALGEATFGTLAPRPTTGTVYTTLYYILIL